MRFSLARDKHELPNNIISYNSTNHCVIKNKIGVAKPRGLGQVDDFPTGDLEHQYPLRAHNISVIFRSFNEMLNLTAIHDGFFEGMLRIKSKRKSCKHYSVGSKD